MRVRPAAVAVGIAVVASAGCGASSSGGASSGAVPTGGATASPTLPGSPSADPLRSPKMQPPAAVRPLPTQTAPVAEGQRRISLPWTYLGQRSGGRAIVLQTAVGGCTRFSGVQVTQSQTSVEVTVWGQQPNNGRQICPALAQLVAGTVQLAAPLGDRTLLHAPVTRP